MLVLLVLHLLGQYLLYQRLLEVGYVYIDYLKLHLLLHLVLILLLFSYRYDRIRLLNLRFLQVSFLERILQFSLLVLIYLLGMVVLLRLGLFVFCFLLFLLLPLGIIFPFLFRKLLLWLFFPLSFHLLGSLGLLCVPLVHLL